MNSDPLAPVRHVLATRARTESPTPECVDDDTIAALAAGALDPSLRLAVLPHVATCARCRAAVASVARALADSAVAREVRAVEGEGGRRWWRIVVPAAAAALLLVLVWPQQVDDGGPSHRAPPITAGPAPVLMSPVGAVAAVETLRWAAVAGADRYRATLFDAQGRVLYEIQLADTAAALPDSVRLVPGRSYLWKVEARIGFDRWAASELIEFSIARGPPR